VKDVVIRGFPFSSRVTLVMSAGFPVPETVRVREVRVTVEALGFVSWICSTGTLEAPGGWLELAGGLGPCAATIVTSVGVGEAVGVAVLTKV